MPGPFDDLDPDDPAGAAQPPPVDRRPRREKGPRRSARARGPKEVGAFSAFARGLVRRCPRCGAGRLFVTRFRVRERCPRCGLRLEREEGGFLGAMTINYAATAVVWLAVFVVWLVIDLPDVHVLQLTLVSIGVAVLVPLLFWPTSKTLWAAVDYLVYRTDPEYVSRDAADRAGGNGGAARR